MLQKMLYSNTMSLLKTQHKITNLEITPKPYYNKKLIYCYYNYLLGNTANVYLKKQKFNCTNCLLKLINNFSYTCSSQSSMLNYCYFLPEKSCSSGASQTPRTSANHQIIKSFLCSPARHLYCQLSSNQCEQIRGRYLALIIMLCAIARS